jgi:hypothetical protein
MLYYNPYTGLNYPTSPEIFTIITNYILLALGLARGFQALRLNSVALYQKLKASQDLRHALRTLLPFFILISWSSVFVLIFAAYLFIDPCYAYRALVAWNIVAGPLTMQCDVARLVPNLASQRFNTLVRASRILQYVFCVVASGLVVAVFFDSNLAKYLVLIQTLYCPLGCLSHLSVYWHIKPLLNHSQERTQLVLIHSSASAVWSGIATIVYMVHVLCPQFLWVSFLLLAGIESSDHVANMFMCSIIERKQPETANDENNIGPTNLARMEAAIAKNSILEGANTRSSAPSDHPLNSTTGSTFQNSFQVC